MQHDRQSEVERSQATYYKKYYGIAGSDRNDLLRNPGVLFQLLASERAFILAAKQIHLKFSEAQVLAVGCGAGADFYRLLQVGAKPKNMTGIDILQERLSVARDTFPGINFFHADAASMPFPGNVYDLVFEGTMFATLPDDQLSSRIAREMLRVCKPGGYILLLDWKTEKPGDAAFKALTRKRVSTLFGVGDKSELVNVSRGALIPPVGRFLSAYAPALYFLISAMFPVLVGQVAYLLQKKQ